MNQLANYSPHYAILENGVMFPVWAQSVDEGYRLGEQRRRHKGYDSPITCVIRIDSPLWAAWTEKQAPVVLVPKEKFSFWKWLKGKRK